MMNWNSNDTKYIIKRIILYFIIAGIVFFAGQSCAKALTYSNFISDSNNYKEIQPNYTSVSFQVKDNNGTYRDTFINAGTGYLIFNYMINQGANSTVSPIYEISIQTYPQAVFNCETTNLSRFIDSSVDYTIGTAKCPIQFTDGKGLRYIWFHRQFGVGTIGVTISKEATIVTTESEATGIISEQANTTTAIVNASMTQIAQNNQINANLQAIQSAVGDSITATNNNTQAINNQTEWFEEQHDPLIDTGFLDVMGDLITTNDSDVVRQFIMIPFNLFVQIYNACTSNTCSALTLGTLYGTTLTLPCINWTTLVGSAIANTIDIIFSACLIFGMYRMIKHMINKIFTLSSTITDECGVEVFN